MYPYKVSLVSSIIVDGCPLLENHTVIYMSHSWSYISVFIHVLYIVISIYMYPIFTQLRDIASYLTIIKPLAIFTPI